MTATETLSDLFARGERERTSSVKIEPLAESCELSARGAFFDGAAAHGIELVDDCGHVAAPVPWYILDEVAEATTDALQLRR